jgi:hypothetical protein
MVGHTLGLTLIPQSAIASGGSLYISELQTGGSGTGHANDEFIELYNATTNDISLKGWKIEYRATSTANGDDCAKGWTKSVALPDKLIKSHQFFLLSDRTYPLVADATFNLDLSGTSGTIRVLDAEKETIDALAWGDASCGLGRPAGLGAGQSLERLPGAQVAQGGNGYDTGDNANDFLVRQSPEPQSTLSPAEEPLQFAGETANSSLEISEVLVNPAPGAAAGPFIEFYNNGPDALVLSGYNVKVGPTGYYLPARVILPDAYMTIQSETFPLNLDPNGSSLLLNNALGTTIDEVTWPTAPAGASRIWQDDAWTWTLSPTPGATNEYNPLPEPTITAPAAAPSPPSLEISELLPDPASPASDAEDEYIEVHNLGSTPVDLDGYSLRTGSSLSDSYVLPSVMLAPDAYMAFKSADSHLTLANGGSTVAVFGPDGRQVGERVAYGAAKAGQSWAKITGSWLWTSTPTPDAPNIFTAPPLAASSVKSSKAKSAKATGKVKSAAAKKASAKKTAKPKAKKAAKAKKASKKTLQPLVAAAGTPTGHWLLFVLAGLTIAYIIYEFRYDLLNLYRRLRGNPGPGPAPGPTPAGRGSDRARERSGRRQDDLRPGTRPRPRVQW